MNEPQDIAIQYREVRDGIRAKLAARPEHVNANGWSDADRALAEQADRNRNQGWSQAEIQAANATRTAAEVEASPTGMKRNPAQGASAGGGTPLVGSSHEARMRFQTSKAVFDGGVTQR